MKDSNDRYNLPARIDHTRGFTRKDFNSLKVAGSPVVQRNDGFTIENDITASFFSLTAREKITKGDPIELSWTGTADGGAWIAKTSNICGIAANDAEIGQTLTVLRQGELDLDSSKWPANKIIFATKDGKIGIDLTEYAYTAGYTRTAGKCVFLFGGSGGGGNIDWEDVPIYELPALKNYGPLWGRAYNDLSTNHNYTVTIQNPVWGGLPWSTDCEITGNIEFRQNPGMFTVPRDGVVSAIALLTSKSVSDSSLSISIVVNREKYVALQSITETEPDKLVTVSTNTIISVTKGDTIELWAKCANFVPLLGMSLEISYVGSTLSINNTETKVAEWGHRYINGNANLPAWKYMIFDWQDVPNEFEGTFEEKDGAFIMPRDGVIHASAVITHDDGQNNWNDRDGMTIGFALNGTPILHSDVKSEIQADTTGDINQTSASTSSLIQVKKGDKLALYLLWENKDTFFTTTLDFSAFYIDYSSPTIQIDNQDSAHLTSEWECSSGIGSGYIPFNCTNIESSKDIQVLDNNRIKMPRKGIIIFTLNGTIVSDYDDNQDTIEIIGLTADTITVHAHKLFGMTYLYSFSQVFKVTDNVIELRAGWDKAQYSSKLAQCAVGISYLDGTTTNITNNGPTHIENFGSGGGSGGTAELPPSVSENITNITNITENERKVGDYLGEAYFEKIIDITAPEKTGIVKDTFINDLKIKRLISIDALMDTDGCFLPNGVNNGFGVWYSHALHTLRCHVLANYAPYFNAPIRVTLRYTRTDTEGGATETFSTGSGLGNAASMAIAVVDRNMSVRYIVPKNTTWNRGKSENYVENETLPLEVTTGKQYKLISPFGTQVCLAEAYIKHSGIWQKVTGTDYNATNKHFFLGTIASCPGDGYVYLTTGNAGLCCAVGGLSSPYVADNIESAEVIIALYCPDEGMDKTADIVIGGGGGSGGSGDCGCGNMAEIISGLLEGKLTEGIITRRTVVNDKFCADIETADMLVCHKVGEAPKYPWRFTKADEPNDGFELVEPGYILCKRAGCVVMNSVVGAGDKDWTDLYMTIYALAAFPSAQKKDEETETPEETPAENTIMLAAETDTNTDTTEGEGEDDKEEDKGPTADELKELLKSDATWKQYIMGYTTRPAQDSYTSFAAGACFVDVEKDTLIALCAGGNVVNYTGDETIEGYCRFAIAYIETEEKITLNTHNPDDSENTETQG